MIVVAQNRYTQAFLKHFILNGLLLPADHNSRLALAKKLGIEVSPGNNVSKYIMLND